MAVSTTNFEFIQDLARRKAAIVLEPGKEYLVETRLAPIARDKGLDSLDDLIDMIREDGELGELEEKAVDALTTNETFFFRDFHPFEAVRKEILPKLIEERKTFSKLTIWCGASSTGQEPYSLAMLIREHFPELASWSIRILATDYSNRVLEKAKSGRYSQLEVNRGLPASYLIKYFTKDGNDWVIKDEIRKMVEYSRLNLVESWPIIPPLDMVWVRNVMIYFDVESKRSILKRVGNCILPHGYLFLGTSETTLNIDPAWKPLQIAGTTVYQKSEG